MTGDPAHLAAALERLAGSRVVILGPFLLMPDDCERLEVYRALGVQRGADMLALDRAVVRAIVDRAGAGLAVASVAVA